MIFPLSLILDRSIPILVWVLLEANLFAEKSLSILNKSYFGNSLLPSSPDYPQYLLRYRMIPPITYIVGKSHNGLIKWPCFPICAKMGRMYPNNPIYTVYDIYIYTYIHWEYLRIYQCYPNVLAWDKNQPCNGASRARGLSDWARALVPGSGRLACCPGDVMGSKPRPLLQWPLGKATFNGDFMVI